MIDLLETVKAITDPRPLPEQKLFDTHWAAVLQKSPEAKDFRSIAEVWFLWGYSDGRFER